MYFPFLFGNVKMGHSAISSTRGNGKEYEQNVETRKQTLPLGYPVPNGKSLAIVCVESK